MTRLTLCKRVLVCLTAAFLVASSVSAMKLNHQGILTDSGGNPVTGNVSIRFTLHDSATDPTELWAETQSVDVVDGLFSVVLGSVTPIDPSLFSIGGGTGSGMFLGIQVGSDGQIVPRTELTAAPFAMHSSTVEGFNPGPNNENFGLYSFVGGDSNTVHSDHSSILGGTGNTVDVTEFADTVFDTSLTAPLMNFRMSSIQDAPGSGVILGGHVNTVCGNHAVIVEGWQNNCCAAYSIIGDGFRNNITAPYSGIVTGAYNDISVGPFAFIGSGIFNRSASLAAVIGGGVLNTTTAGFRAQVIGGGWRNFTDNNFSTISGGLLNRSVGNYSNIGGGQSDSATGDHSTVAGGFGNHAVDQESSIGGGSGNRTEGRGSTVAGGGRNVTSIHEYQFIGGGQNNRATGPWSTIGGGLGNQVVHWAFVGGGQENLSTNEYTTVGGGLRNRADQLWASVLGGIDNVSTNNAATVGGGQSNEVFGSHSFVGGGFTNVIQADTAVIGGGSTNQVTGAGGTIGGGLKNGVFSLGGTIGGGQGNGVAGDDGVVGGGNSNRVGPGAYATVPGGFENGAVGRSSFAAGNRALASDSCSFVWADCCEDPTGVAGFLPFESFLPKSYNARATNGFYFVTGCDSVVAPGTAQSGAFISAGGSLWQSLSSRDAKKNIEEVDGAEILEKVSELPLYHWTYNTQDDSIRHLGPMAEDFYETFAVGESEKTITALDPAGVSLAASKQLIEENKELKERVAKLEKLVEALIEDND